MSKIGKQIIKIPSGTTVTQTEDKVLVKGPKGELTRFFRPVVEIKIDGDQITLLPKKSDVETYSLWGTYASHLKNMVMGVNDLFTKKLILEGIGFKSEVAGKVLNLALGFSHPVKVPIPDGITATAEKNLITISGIDKELVGGFAAHVRALKKPEPYKGKGFHYEGEVIRRKQGKKTA